ncbi:MAG: cupin domain-containing protein [Pseudazoarcus pumilus]|nr:cupin domain-containing protein [Pseudazoarcus pumilus]
MSEPLATQVVCGNLLSALPAPAGGEAFENLFEAAGLRIERIVSHEHASPEGFWYEQPQDEWVMVASGEAVIEFGDGSRRTLRAGDWLVLPAGLRHRVAATFERTVWLTVHHFRNNG